MPRERQRGAVPSKGKPLAKMVESRRAAGAEFPIVEKLISSLNAAEYNPRTLTDRQKREIRNSIEGFGFVEPVVINVNPDRLNVVVGGHQRLKVLKEMGYTKVRCVEVNLSLEQERILNLRLNKNTGDWDYDRLAELFSDDELLSAGWTQEELDATFEDVDEEKGGGRNDDMLDFTPQLDETADYLIVTFRSKAEREKVLTMLRLLGKKVKSSTEKAKGPQRVIDGKDFLHRLETISDK